MNSIAKCFAMVAIIAFGLSACGGESSGESTGTMGGSLDLSQLSEAAVRGHAIYEGPTQACSTCHGRLGEGGIGGPVDNVNDCTSCASHAQLTAYNEALMPFPPYNPGACVGACASDVSAYIFEGFIQGKVLPGANNNPAINVNPTSGLTTTEAGGMASFTVSVNSLPTDDVTIGLSSDNAAEGTVNPTLLTFTPANWQQPQTVMVTGVDDANLDGNVVYSIVTAAATSNDVEYSGMDAADVAVTNTDNEIPPPGVINVVPTTGLVTSEDGQAATFTIVLGTVPTANVSIGLTSSNAAEGTVSPASIVFTAGIAGNYNVPQTVTVTGVDDAANPMVDGNIAYSVVTAAAISNDPSYSGLDASDVSVTNNDNDVQPVIASFTADPVSNAAAPIPYAGMVTLNWMSDGDACTAGGATANGQWTGALLPSGAQTLINLTTSGVNTFTVVCTKGGIDSAPASVDVTVAAQPGAPTVTLTANPVMNVQYNGMTTLTWSTTDATSCVASSNPANAAWDDANKALTGTQAINNLTAANNTFTLACTNAGGLITTVNVNVTVVQPNPTVTLTASPAMIGQGQATMLTWTTTDLASCTASAAPANAQWTGAKGVLASQNQAINNLQETTAFTLNCTGINGANVAANATVTIDPTSTGQYLYNTELFGGLQTCADAGCHGLPGNPGLFEILFGLSTFDKAVLCAKYTNTAGLVTKFTTGAPPLSLPMPYALPADTCDAACATKVLNYMFLNFYAGNTTDCEGGALPLALP